MSSLTKKKHVYQETINSYEPPSANQLIVKVKAPRGNNLHDVETSEKTEFIVTMPTKFRKTMSFFDQFFSGNKGDYLIVEPIEEGNKVKAEIIQILTRDYIKFLKEENLWPNGFDVDSSSAHAGIDEDLLPPAVESDDDTNSDENFDNIENIPVNYNRNALFNINKPNNDLNSKNADKAV